MKLLSSIIRLTIYILFIIQITPSLYAAEGGRKLSTEALPYTPTNRHIIYPSFQGQPHLQVPEQSPFAYAYGPYNRNPPLPQQAIFYPPNNGYPQLYPAPQPPLLPSHSPYPVMGGFVPQPPYTLLSAAPYQQPYPPVTNSAFQQFSQATPLPEGPNAKLFRQAQAIKDLKDDDYSDNEESNLKIKLPDNDTVVDFSRPLGKSPRLLDCLKACAENKRPLTLIYGERRKECPGYPTVLALPGEFINDGTFEKIEIYSCTNNETSGTTIENITTTVYSDFLSNDQQQSLEQACSELCHLNNGDKERVKKWKALSAQPSTATPASSLLGDEERAVADTDTPTSTPISPATENTIIFVQENTQQPTGTISEHQTELPISLPLTPNPATSEDEKIQFKALLQKSGFLLIPSTQTSNSTQSSTADRENSASLNNTNNQNTTEENLKEAECIIEQNQAIDSVESPESTEVHNNAASKKTQQRAAQRKHKQLREKEERKKQKEAVQKQQEKQKAQNLQKKLEEKSVYENARKKREDTERKKREEAERKKQEEAVQRQQEEQAQQAAKEAAEKKALELLVQSKLEREKQEQERERALAEQREKEAQEEKERKQRIEQQQKEQQKAAQKKRQQKKAAASKSAQQQRQDDEKTLNEELAKLKQTKEKEKENAPSVSDIIRAYNSENVELAKSKCQERKRHFKLSDDEHYLLGVAACKRGNGTESMPEKNKWHTFAANHLEEVPQTSKFYPTAQLTIGKIYYGSTDKKSLITAARYLYQSQTPEGIALLVNLCTEHKIHPEGKKLSDCLFEEKTSGKCHHAAAYKIIRDYVSTKTEKKDCKKLLTTQANLLRNHSSCLKQIEEDTEGLCLDLYRRIADADETDTEALILLATAHFGNANIKACFAALDEAIERERKHGKGKEPLEQALRLSGTYPGEKGKTFLKYIALLNELVQKGELTQKAQQEISQFLFHPSELLSQGFFKVAINKIVKKAITTETSQDELNQSCLVLKKGLSSCVSNDPAAQHALQEIETWQNQQKKEEEIIHRTQENFKRFCDEEKGKKPDQIPSTQEMVTKFLTKNGARLEFFIPFNSQTGENLVNPFFESTNLRAAYNKRLLPLSFGIPEFCELEHVLPHLNPPLYDKILLQRFMEASLNHLHKTTPPTAENIPLEKLPYIIQAYVKAYGGDESGAIALLQKNSSTNPVILRMHAQLLLRLFIRSLDEENQEFPHKQLLKETLDNAVTAGDSFSSILSNVYHIIEGDRSGACSSDCTQCPHQKIVEQGNKFLKMCPSCKENPAILCYPCQATHEILAVIHDPNTYSCKKVASDIVLTIKHLSQGGAPHMLLEALSLELEKTSIKDEQAILNNFLDCTKMAMETTRSLQQFCKIISLITLSKSKNPTFASLAELYAAPLKKGEYYTPGEPVLNTRLMSLVQQLPDIATLLEDELTYIGKNNQTTHVRFTVPETLKYIDHCAFSFQNAFPSLALFMASHLAAIRCKALELLTESEPNPIQKTSYLKSLLLNIENFLRTYQRNYEMQDGSSAISSHPPSLVPLISSLEKSDAILQELQNSNVDNQALQECAQFLVTIQKHLLAHIKSRIGPKLLHSDFMLPGSLFYLFPMAAHTEDKEAWKILHNRLEEVLQKEASDKCNFSNMLVAFSLRNVLRNIPNLDTVQTATLTFLENFITLQAKDTVNLRLPECKCYDAAPQKLSSCETGTYCQEMTALGKSVEILHNIVENPLKRDAFEENNWRFLISAAAGNISLCITEKPTVTFIYHVIASHLLTNINGDHSPFQALSNITTLCNFLKLTAYHVCNYSSASNFNKEALSKFISILIHTEKTLGALQLPLHYKAPLLKYFIHTLTYINNVPMAIETPQTIVTAWETVQNKVNNIAQRITLVDNALFKQYTDTPSDTAKKESAESQQQKTPSQQNEEVAEYIKAMEDCFESQNNLYTNFLAALDIFKNIIKIDPNSSANNLMFMNFAEKIAQGKFSTAQCKEIVVSCKTFSEEWRLILTACCLADLTMANPDPATLAHLATALALLNSCSSYTTEDNKNALCGSLTMFLPQINEHFDSIWNDIFHNDPDLKTLFSTTLTKGLEQDCSEYPQLKDLIMEIQGQL